VVRRPMILLGAVVALVSACDRGATPPTGAALPDSADQVLWGVTTNITIDGVLRIKIQADTVYSYQTSQVMDLVGVKVEFFTPDGRVSSTVTSREGTFETRSQDMEARGDVVATTPDGKRLTTDTLRYNRTAQMISGPGPFVFDGPGGEHIEGTGFTADTEFSNVRAGQPRRGRPGVGDIG